MKLAHSQLIFKPFPCILGELCFFTSANNFMSSVFMIYEIQVLIKHFLNVNKITHFSQKGKWSVIWSENTVIISIYGKGPIIC